MSSSFQVRLPIGALVGSGIAVIMACGNSDRNEDDTQFRQDVIWCEEAVAKLSDCCGGAFDPSTVECRHYYSKDTGCGQLTIERTDPAFTTAESECLRNASCDSIQQGDMCKRATAAGKARYARYEDRPADGISSSTSSTSSSGGSSATGPVCP